MARRSPWAAVVGSLSLGLAILVGSIVPLRAGPEQLATEIIRLSAQRNGLLQQVVYCLERDRLGRVWAGTRNGPFVYNGRRWTPVALPPTATSLQVRAILQSLDGSIWFGTQEGGLWRLQQGLWEHFDSSSGLPADRVNALAEWGSGPGPPSLWVGTTGGVVRFEGGKWASASQGLPSPWTWKFRSVKSDLLPKGLWVATQKGLAHWQESKWIPHEGAMPAKEVNDFLEVEESPAHFSIWASFWNLGVGRFDGQNWKVYGAAEGFPSVFPAILASLPGPDGNQFIGVGTYDRGLALFKEGTWQLLNVDRGLPHEGVFSLLLDPGGDHPFVWVGTRGGGVTTLGLEGSARVLNAHSGLPAGEVQSMLTSITAKRETYWFGTPKGLARYSESVWKIFTRANGLPADSVTALAEGADGTLWIGTESGLGLLKPGAHQGVLVPGLKEPISALCVEGPKIWIGTRRGLWRYEASSLTKAEGPPGEAEILSLALGLAPAGTNSLWVGTRGKGLLQGRHGQWTRHDPNPEFPRSALASLLVERGPQGQEWIWAGTLGNGLARLDLSQPKLGWRSYSTRSPVPLVENMARALARDSAGFLYIGMSYGLSKVRFDFDGTSIIEVEALGPGEGLPPKSCFLGAAMTDARGQVWFGFPEGAVAIRPKPILKVRPPPAPVLERVFLFGKEFELVANARLNHRQNHLAFEFFVPWFRREESIYFRSQLLGLETEPTPWLLDNRREFPALGAGHYRLRVWAKDYQERETDPLDIPFRIAPAPWFHPLALLSYAVLLTASLVLLIRLRTRYLRRRNEILEAAVAVATANLREANQRLRDVNEEKNQFLGIAAHDLKNPLNGIILMMEVMEGEDDLQEIESIRAKVQKAARRMADLIGKLLDVNALESGHRQLPHKPVDLQALARDAAQEFTPAAKAKGLRIEVLEGSSSCVAMGDAGTLREVAGNLISNALKFMPAGTFERAVTVRTGTEAERVFLEVQDEGPGFTLADKQKAFGRFVRLSAQPTSGENSTGLGLAIVKQLVEAMGGEVTLDSEPGHGATLKVLLAKAPAEP